MRQKKTGTPKAVATQPHKEKKKQFSLGGINSLDCCWVAKLQEDATIRGEDRRNKEILSSGVGIKKGGTHSVEAAAERLLRVLLGWAAGEEMG